MTTMSTLGEVRPEHEPGAELVLLHYLRSFRLPVLDVWSACTEYGQLSRWLGTVSGSAGTRSVDLLDGPVPGTVTVRIERCVAPHELVLDLDGCILEARLTQVGVLTNLELIRRHLCPTDAPDIGPRWQYLLDRLTAYLSGAPLPSWSEYPALAGEYR
ncbi:hypothetical protein ACFVMC_19215 [Nocardia sp. NPDC127579]|uniref:hypothetical protein n=1 Tax=Nocardia sp. NPDC127579 TaxID=3345402 RepID=UPI00362A8E3E